MKLGLVDWERDKRVKRRERGSRIFAEEEAMANFDLCCGKWEMVKGGFI